MRDLTGLRVRNTKYPTITGTVIGQLAEWECPERPDFPQFVTVKWDDMPWPALVPLKHLEEHPT